MGRRAKATTNGKRHTPAAGPAVEDEETTGIDGDDTVEADADELAADEEIEAEPSSTDNVGEQSVEINVQDLLAQLEAESGRNETGTGCARRKLEDYLEEKRIARDLQDMEDFDI